MAIDLAAFETTLKLEKIIRPFQAASCKAARGRCSAIVILREGTLHEESLLLLVSGVAVAGVAGQWLGWRLGMPAIIPLLLFGLVIGPGLQLVQPSSVLGDLMRPAIGFAVAIIVFEGGLNLNLRELRSSGSGILRLVAFALPLNWIFGAFAAHWLGGLSWPVAILLSSILIVTGPTVILPLLRQARLEPRCAAFLKWEAIVNDPLGATFALLVLGFLTQPSWTSDKSRLIDLGWHTLVGGGIAAALGLLLPYGIRLLFRRDMVPEFLKTPMLLSGAIGIYAAGEAIQAETGLIGATLFGFVLANIDITGLQELRRFKESLTVFLVSGLFILLTANIDRKVLLDLSWPIALTTLAILLVVRPLATWLATIGARMSFYERLLVGWIGPRGVVAAAVAGISGDRLVQAGYPDGAVVLPLVFAVISATVLLHGLTLAPLARFLGLASSGKGGLLVVGASAMTVALGETIRGLGIPVILVDRTQIALRPARLAGLYTLRLEILSDLADEILDLRDIAHVLAATPDDAYNALVCTRFGPELGRERVHQLAPAGDLEKQSLSREWRGKIAFARELDHPRLAKLMEDGSTFVVDPIAAIEQPVEHTVATDTSWPMLRVSMEGEITFISPEIEGDQNENDLTVRLCPPLLVPSIANRQSRKRFGRRSRM